MIEEGKPHYQGLRVGITLIQLVSMRVYTVIECHGVKCAVAGASWFWIVCGQAGRLEQRWHGHYLGTVFNIIRDKENPPNDTGGRVIRNRRREEGRGRLEMVVSLWVSA